MDKFKNIAILILLAVILLLQFDKCSSVNTIDELSSELNLSKQTYTKERDKYNQLVVKQKAVETYHKQFIDSVAKDFEVKLNKAKAAIKYEYKTKIDTLEIPTIDTLTFYKDSSSGLKIKRFKEKNPYYEIEADVDSTFTRLRLSNITFKDTLLVLENSKGFFTKKTEYVIISKSPYSDISGVKSVKLKARPRKAVRILEFIIVGILGYKTYELIH